MTLVIQKLTGDEYEQIARVENGRLDEGSDMEGARLLASMDLEDEEGVLMRLDGPRYLATQVDAEDLRQARVPDNAVSIQDKSEAPEGASTVTGPKGGLYYVPGTGMSEDDDSGEGDERSGEEILEKAGLSQAYSSRELQTGAEPVGELETLALSPKEQEEFQAPFDALAAEPKTFAVDGDGMSLPEEAQHDAIESFGGWPNSEATVPLWAYAREETGNDLVHPDLEGEVENANLSEEDREKMENHAQASREFHRQYDPTYDPETDTVKVYRGVGGDLASNLVQNRADGVEVEHRALESWTSDPLTAGQFAQSHLGGQGAVIEARVPVDQVASSFGTNDSLFGGEEAEVVVMGDDEAVSYDRSNIREMDDLEESGEFRSQTAPEARNAWLESAQEVIGDGD